MISLGETGCQKLLKKVVKLKVLVSIGETYAAFLNPLSANPTKWSNTLKQFVGKLPTNCLSVFDHFVKLTLNPFMQNVVKWPNLL